MIDGIDGCRWGCCNSHPFNATAIQSIRSSHSNGGPSVPACWSLVVSVHVRWMVSNTPCMICSGIFHCWVTRRSGPPVLWASNRLMSSCWSVCPAPLPGPNMGPTSRWTVRPNSRKYAACRSITARDQYFGPASILVGGRGFRRRCTEP